MTSATLCNQLVVDCPEAFGTHSGSDGYETHQKKLSIGGKLDPIVEHLFGM